MDKFIAVVEKVNSAVNNVVWGVPALVLLIGTGILITIYAATVMYMRSYHPANTKRTGVVLVHFSGRK